MSTTYTDKIRDIAINTFEITCYMFPLEEWELVDTPERVRPDGSLRSIVHFDGAAEGGMVINPSGDLLEAMAANMLGVDEASQDDKEGALCEIANIICGNTVPLFAKNQNICYIRPPRIAKPDEDMNEIFKDMKQEHIQLILDEGIADIFIFYRREDEK